MQLNRRQLHAILLRLKVSANNFELLLKDVELFDRDISDDYVSDIDSLLTIIKEDSESFKLHLQEISKFLVEAELDKMEDG